MTPRHEESFPAVTGVLQKFRREVTRNFGFFGKNADQADLTDANAKQPLRVCHDTLPWLISISLGRWSRVTMRSQIKAAWDWLPVIVRAIVLGWVLLTIGSTVTFLPLLGNLKFHPEIPWAFPVTIVILALYRSLLLRLGTSRCHAGRTQEARTLLIALRANLACSNSSNGVRDHRTCCAAIALTESYAGSRAIGLDLAFYLSVANDHWRIAFDRHDRRRHRGDRVPRIYAETVRGNLWHRPSRSNRWDNVLGRPS